MNGKIDDYDKIVIKCVKESLLLSNGSGNINEFKSQLQNLMILNQLPQFKSTENDQLLNLIIQLYEIDINSNNNSILLFFYKNNCKPSSDFVKEWQEIKLKTNNKHKMISINCENEKYAQICSKLNVYEYPTIKYAKNGKIIDYLGEMTSQEIIRTLKL
jgi:thioredoxin-like negative regulator of GroEL